ncbi:MAG: TlpA family protein disulfide reductase [Deinococcus sp.]|nr:TlpA family protein disulfide reductase [Deinococcus sp.]MCL5964386.1 TlpA family protein disulfide reductase [Deinococcus sp.]
MKFTPDALQLGPLVLEWGRFAFVLGLLVFLGVASRAGKKLDGAAWLVALSAVVVARLGYAALNLDAFSQSGVLASLTSLVDIRTGGFYWPLGLAAGLAAALLVLKRDWVRLLPALGFGVVGAILPMLLKPSTVLDEQIPAKILFQQVSATEKGRDIAWQDIPKPVLVNVFATWCPPCRAEMPLLAEYRLKGYPIVFVNAGEGASIVQSFLLELHLPVGVYLDRGVFQEAVKISGLPTTLLIDTDGRVKERYLGALDKAGLEALLSKLNR